MTYACGVHGFGIGPAPQRPPATSSLDRHHMYTLLGMLQYSTWGSMPRDDRCSLRLTCQQALRLADHLTTHLHLHDGHGSSCFELRPWNQEVTHRMAHLARLPHLRSLQLSDWPGKASLVRLIRHYGTATHGQLTHLVLSGDGLSAHATREACSACPQLQQLELIYGAPDVPSPRLLDDILSPLLSLPLTKVGFVGSAGWCVLRCEPTVGGQQWAGARNPRPFRAAPACWCICVSCDVHSRQELVPSETWSRMVWLIRVSSLQHPVLQNE